MGGGGAVGGLGRPPPAAMPRSARRHPSTTLPPGARRPHLDSSGAAHWPLVFVYPEAGGASDAVEDACESDTLGAHLDAMFGPGAPPLQWDSENAYGRDRLEVYYLSHATQPLALGPLTEASGGGFGKGPARAWSVPGARPSRPSSSSHPPPFQPLFPY